jgi:hypothetical protein
MIERNGWNGYTVMIMKEEEGVVGVDFGTMINDWGMARCMLGLGG